MAAVLLVASPAIILVLVLLIAVVVGIRQEPPATELRTKAPTRLAALVRRLLGVSVRRPEPQETDDQTPELCFAGHSASYEER